MIVIVLSTISMIKTHLYRCLDQATTLHQVLNPTELFDFAPYAAGIKRTP